MTSKISPYLLIFFLVVCFSSKSQTIEIMGSINENTNWDADTVKIIGDVTVENDVLLSISPGVYVEAQGYFRLNILGNIHAIGLPNDTIIFTVKDTTGFWSDTTGISGSWNGVYIIGDEGSADSSKFKYCKFQYGKNYDEYGGDINGGALYVYNHGFLHINNCRFENNMAICFTTGVNGPFGGAVYCENVDRVLIDSSYFIKNRSFDQGGAIRIDDNCKNTVITKNTFISNTGFFRNEAPPPWGYIIGGGGAAVSTSDLVYSPEISSNLCFNNKGLNGIIYTSNLHARIFNNIICNNWGCGIADGHQLSTSKTFNNTIVNNKTMYGGILIWSKAEVYNNICWGNSFYEGVMYEQIYIDNANPTLKFNCVQYGDGGQGAVYEYPQFEKPTEGTGPEYDGSTADWALKNWSTSINAGTPDTISLTIPACDIIGNMRVYGNRLDMGAIENQEIWVYSNEITLVEENVRIFPNPAKSLATIYFKDSDRHKPQTVSILDVSGNEIYNTELSADQLFLELNVSTWKSGLYLVVVSSTDNTLSRTKLIVN
jgi:predicted outer membrane repeat protein